MKTKVECPACAQPIEAAGSLIGQSIVCPSCNVGFIPSDAVVVPDPAPRPYQQLEMQNQPTMQQQCERTRSDVKERTAYTATRVIAIILMVLFAIAGVGTAVYWGAEKDNAVAAWSVLLGTLVGEVIFYAATILLCDIADLLIELVRQGRDRKS